MDESKVLSEAAGRSFNQIKFIISQPMANMLTLINGTRLRARALDWFLGEGLLAATGAREKLLKMVMDAIHQGDEEEPEPIPMPQPPKNVMPTKKVSGMAMEFAMLPYEYQGADPNTLNAQDLFSPEAYERHPILWSVKLGPENLTITEYYDKHLEPRSMMIEGDPGEYVELSLADMRRDLVMHGLEPFKYGGFDGYIQFTEKGDYLPRHEKRSSSPNKQHGFDLRPYSDPKAVDNKGKQVYNFAGGSYSPDMERAENTIHSMRSSFAHVARTLETNAPNVPKLNAKQKELVEKILKTKAILQTSKEQVLPGVGRRISPAIVVGLGDNTHGPARMPMPNIDPSMYPIFMQLIRQGLAQPKKRNKNAFKTPGNVWKEWDGETQPEPDGWYRYDGNSIVFKLSTAQQTDILNFIKSDFQTEHKLRVRIDADELARRLPSFDGLTPGSGTRWHLSELFNDGLKSNEALRKQIQVYDYQRKGFDPSKYTRSMKFKKLEVNPTELAVKQLKSDPVLVHLFDNGYNWDLRNGTAREKAQGWPDFMNRGSGILRHNTGKGASYKVVYDPDAQSHYLLLPDKDQQGDSVNPPTFHHTGTSYLLGGHEHGGGIGSKHLDMNPTDQGRFDTLQRSLLGGGIGEPKSVNTEMDLESVQKGVASAANRYKVKFGPVPETKERLESWGVEGLWAFAGDPAFQRGYITNSEIRGILGWNPGNEFDIATQAPGQGRGITALLVNNWNRQYGKLSAELANQIIGIVMSIEKDSPDGIIDLENSIREAFRGHEHEFDVDGIIKAFHENALKARAREVAKYVFARLKQTLDDNAKKAGGKGFHRSGEGEEGSFDQEANVASGKQKNRGQDDEDIKDRIVVSPDDLYAIWKDKNPNAVEEPVAPPVPTPTPAPEAPKQLATPGGAAPPRRPATTAPVANPMASKPAAPAKLSALDMLRANMQQVRKPAAAPATPQASRAVAQTPPPAPTPKPAAPAAPAKLSPLEILRANMQQVRRPKNENRLLSYHDWIKETYAIFDPSVSVHDGCGFNWEGAAGKKGGVSISGEVDTVKTDPDGTKENRNVRKARKPRAK